MSGGVLGAGRRRIFVAAHLAVVAALGKEANADRLRAGQRLPARVGRRGAGAWESGRRAAQRLG